MPLPRTPVNFHFLNKDSKIVEDVVFTRKETGYQPTAEYAPTMRLVKCSFCGEVGACEFLGGLNLKEGDRIMAGKPIKGTCLKCNKKVELVPLPTDQQNEPHLRMLYQFQQSLDEATRRGERFTPNSMVWPLERVLEWERWKRGEAAGG